MEFHEFQDYQIFTVETTLDPRCFSEERPVPPPGLPFVSRKALKRITHRLPVPTQCNCCGSFEVSLVNNSSIYGKSYGDWPYAYFCKDCKSYVGLHKATDLPLGTLADAQTRRLRKKVKEAFMVLQRVKFAGDRDKAYAWLSIHLLLDPRYCHVSMMSSTLCEEALAVIDKERTTYEKVKANDRGRNKSY